MKRRQLLCALLALCFVLSWIPARAAAAAPIAGPENFTWSFDEATGTLTITGTGDLPDYTVDSAAPWAAHSARITSVVISEGITGVGSMAFSGHFTAITSVTLPSTLTKIGNQAFAGCMSLKTIAFPAGLAQIGDSAFTQCYALTQIGLPASLTHIGAFSFSMCYGLSEVAVPSGTVTIGRGAFAECSNLSEVTFSETVTEIGQLAFAATGLVDVTVPENVTKIGTNAFGGCPELTNVTILNPQCELEEYILGEEGTAATISGFAGSTAQTHAVSCGYGFKEMDKCAIYGHVLEQTGFAATCADRGFTRYTCTVCGYSYEDSYVNALGHSFGDWIQIKAPTTTQAGEAQRTCDTCGEKEYMDIPKLDPEPTDPAPTDPTDPTEETVPVTEPPETTAPTDPTELETQPPTDPTAPTDPEAPKPSGKGSPWGWIFVILLILAAGGGGAAWYFLVYRKQPVGKFSGYYDESEEYDEPEDPEEE